VRLFPPSHIERKRLSSSFDQRWLLYIRADISSASKANEAGPSSRIQKDPDFTFSEHGGRVSVEGQICTLLPEQEIFVRHCFSTRLRKCNIFHVRSSLARVATASNGVQDFSASPRGLPCTRIARQIPGPV
jgi:hypothetical protein